MMKKNIFLSVLISIFGSLGFYCLLNYSLLAPFRVDKRNYPYFLPFCTSAGSVSAVVVVLLIFYNIHILSPKYTSTPENNLRKQYIKKSLSAEIIIIITTFIPFVVLWEFLRGIVGSWF